MKVGHLFQKYGDQCPVSHTDFLTNIFVYYKGITIIICVILVAFVCTYSCKSFLYPSYTISLHFYILVCSHFVSPTVNVNVNQHRSLLNACKYRFSLLNDEYLINIF